MVIRPTEIDQAHKFSGTDGPGPEVIARPQRGRLNVVTLKRIVHDDLALGNTRLVAPNHALPKVPRPDPPDGANAISSSPVNGPHSALWIA
jgi:hypothetical protein